MNIVRWLVEEMENDVNNSSHDGFTPIMCAAKSGKYEICQYLLQKGADIFVENTIKETPLSYAKMNGHKQIVELFSKEEGPIDIKGRTLLGTRNKDPIQTMFQLGGLFVGKHEN
jgi:ankyrin repeat protein